METRNRHFKVLLLGTALIALFFQTSGQDVSQEKKFHFDARTDKDTKLSIENRYGNVTVINGDQDQVVIDVTVTMDVRDKDKAQKLLSYINVNFSNENNEIKAITEIDGKFNNPGNFFNMGDDKHFSIDYTVNMPTNMDFTLQNKYGNVVINQLGGPMNISVKYGNLKANKLLHDDSKPLAQVSLAYSNGTIDEINWLKLELKYSKLEITKSKALVAVTRYSQLHLDEGSSLVCESKYDEYTLGKLVNLVGTAGFTEFKADRVERKLDLTLKYGGCKVEFMPRTFESIKLDDSFADVRIGIEPGASYRLNGNASFADISYPEGDWKLSRVEQPTSLHIDGTVGNQSNPSATVNIQTSYGNVSLER